MIFFSECIIKYLSDSNLTEKLISPENLVTQGGYELLYTTPILAVPSHLLAPVNSIIIFLSFHGLGEIRSEVGFPCGGWGG